MRMKYTIACIQVVGHAQPEGTPRFVSMEQFAADVAEATNGHVKIEVYGNGQLGTEKEMLEQVVAGTVQGMRGGQFDFSPRLLMFTLPFLTNTRAQVTALLQSDLAQKVCAEAEGETGTVIINLCDAGGYRQFSNSKHPIKAPADLKGLKMRTNGMKTIDMTFQAMGATTTTIPYSDLYMGLKTGVADGQENPWVNVEGIHNYGNAHPSGAADLLCRAGHPAGFRHRRFLCDLHPDLCTYLYYHAAAARVERCLQ